MAILFWLVDGQTALLIDPWFKGNPMVRSVPGGLQPALIFVSQGRHDHLGDAIDLAQDRGIASSPESHSCAL